MLNPRLIPFIAITPNPHSCLELVSDLTLFRLMPACMTLGVLTSTSPRTTASLLSIVFLQVTGTEAQEGALHVLTERRPTHG